MSDNKLDIKKWEKKYPILNKVWETYNEFDKTLDGDQYNHLYKIFCDQLMEKLGYDNEEYKSFCLKLIRNLGHYSIGTNYFNPTFERCDILYIWLYHSLKSEDIPDNIIEKCFDDYKDQIKGMTSKYKCTYDSYKSMYLYPMKINILKLFDNNIEILRKILIGTHQSNKTLCRKFVCECVRLYKLMKDTYCHNGRERQENYTNTCTKLKEFEQSYSLLHFNKGLLNLNIPSLNNIDRDLIDKCPSDEGKIVLPLHEDRTLQPALGNRLNVDSGDPNNYLSDVATPVTVDNSMKKHITTSIGTVAGASSLLAFLYKFTPARRLLHSGLRGDIGRIKNTMYSEDANALTFDRLEHSDYNSYNIGYEAT